MLRMAARLYRSLGGHAVLVALLVALFCLPGQAMAAGPNPPDTVPELEDCTGGGFPPEKITSKIVYCVKKTIIEVTEDIFNAITAYMLDTVTVIFAVALTFQAVKIFGGEGEVTSRGMKMLFRLGIIWLFFTDTFGLVYYTYYIMDELIAYALVLTPGFTPWEAIDNFVGRLLGFGGTLTIVQGVIGVVFGAMLSGSVGIPMFASGIMAMYDVLMFVLDVVYTYLTAIITISFMIILSPILIPWAAFRYSERYFKKWLDTVIGAMLTPMLLFGFLSFSIAIFDQLITNTLNELSQNVTNANGDPDFAQFWRMNQPAFGWMMPTDPNYIAQLMSQIGPVACAGGAANCDDQTTILPPVPNVINPFNKIGFNYNLLNVFGVSYDQQMLQKIMLNFVALWMYAMLMKGLIKKMPEIAARIAGMVNPLTVQSAPFKQKIRDLGAGAGAMLGGGLGSQIGGAVNPVMGRQIGAVAGMLGGGQLGNNLAEALNQRISGMVGRR
jgi:type IV secretory pathway VirB6-like protein